MSGLFGVCFKVFGPGFVTGLARWRFFFHFFPFVVWGRFYWIIGPVFDSGCRQGLFISLFCSSKKSLLNNFWQNIFYIDISRHFIILIKELKSMNYAHINNMYLTKNLPNGELNPSPPRDRRGYSPPYYRGQHNFMLPISRYN